MVVGSDEDVVQLHVSMNHPLVLTVDNTFQHLFTKFQLLFKRGFILSDEYVQVCCAMIQKKVLCFEWLVVSLLVFKEGFLNTLWEKILNFRSDDITKLCPQSGKISNDGNRDGKTNRQTGRYWGEPSYWKVVHVHSQRQRQLLRWTIREN